MGSTDNIVVAILVWIGGLAILAMVLHVIVEELFNDYGQSESKEKIKKFIQFGIKLCIWGGGLLIVGSIVTGLFIVTMKAFGIS